MENRIDGCTIVEQFIKKAVLIIKVLKKIVEEEKT